ncbi:hypothetical protein IFM89_003569 [Coptis chinensis]|uniref:Uncharacterized protein n=1 Tax=Coptis chinensis TaxID=261450 RepID=A0A835HVS5_9MAGN|nr:hypothetical protein IFM89_003569 [Coptis chinensis]
MLLHVQGLYVAGVYVGMEYGMERIRGTVAPEIGIIVFMHSDITTIFIFLSGILVVVFISIIFEVLQKNAMLGGVLTGAIVSAATNSSKDKVVMDAIAGGAIATAAEILN